MHIKDNSQAQGWFRRHAAAPSSIGSWKAFVARNKTVQEPRNMYAGGQLVQNTIDGSRPGYAGDDVASAIPKKYTDDLLEKRITLNPRRGPTPQAVTVGEIFEKVNNVEGGSELIADFKKNPTQEKFITLRRKYKNRIKTERIQNLSEKAKTKFRQKTIKSERKWRKSEKGQAYYARYMAEKGMFPANTPEERIWRDIYRAARQKKNSGFEIKFPKNIEINPETGLPKALKSPKGKMYVPWNLHYRDISFVDKKTGDIIKFGGVKEWMKNNVPNGVKKYNNAIENYSLRQNISDIEVKGQTLGDIYKKNKIAQGATPTEVRLASPAAVNHRSGLNNFWDTEVITSTANKQLNDKIQSKISAYKNASPNIKTKIFKQMEVAANKIKGGGSLVIDRQILGKDPTPKKVMASLGKELNIKGLFKTYQNAGIGKNCKAYGGRVGLADAGAVGVSQCMKNAIDEHNKNLKSEDLTVRNAARSKQFNINKTKNMKNILNLGGKGVSKAVRLGKSLGIEFEPIFEGAFYEWGRRNGYTHEQAKEETFFWKMLDPTTKTGLFEGAEPLLEKELYEIKGENEFIDVDNRPPMQDPEFGQVIGERGTVKRYIDNEKALMAAQQKYNDLYRAHQVATEGERGYGIDPEKAESSAKALEATWEEINSLEDKLDLDRDSYQAAVEKQQHTQGMRAFEYGEYGSGDEEKLVKQRERRRQREMEEKFPLMSKSELNKQLEDVGLYVDPKLRYKGQTVQRPKGLKFLPGWTTDTARDYFRDLDKSAYFADNFRMEKAGGGIAGIRRPNAIPPESGPTPYGLPSMLNRVKKV